MQTASPAHAATRAVTYGTTLTFETLVSAPGEGAPVRLRCGEDTLLRVIDGIVHLVQGTEDRLLGIGDETIVPAGTPHRLASAGGEARVVIGFRPAARR
jgi:mannose-6-phosphate isomerase-like protein (cupin superfamily)